MIALCNLASVKTAVIVGWVRSDIARKKGLRVSYFERLRESKRYRSLDPAFITQLQSPEFHSKTDLITKVSTLECDITRSKEMDPNHPSFPDGLNMLNDDLDLSRQTKIQAGPSGSAVTPTSHLKRFTSNVWQCFDIVQMTFPDGTTGPRAKYNASANTSSIALFTERNIPQAEGYFFHQRCACHIINLIVQSSLKEVSARIDRIRYVISWIRSSNTRFREFDRHCTLNGLRSRRFQADMLARWNSTYLMLQIYLDYDTTITGFFNMKSAEISHSQVQAQAQALTSDDWGARPSPPAKRAWAWPVSLAAEPAQAREKNGLGRAAFSMSGRIIEPRSCLTPEMVEVLTCVRDWEHSRKRLQNETVDEEFIQNFSNLFVDECFGNNQYRSFICFCIFSFQRVIAFSVISSRTSTQVSKDKMSVFLQILGCILCCEDERPDDRDDETSYPLLGSGSHNRAIHQSDSTNYGSSSLDQNRVVIGSRTSNSASTERINQVPLNAKDLRALLHAPYTSKPPSTSSSQSPFLSVSSPKPPAVSSISCPSSAPKSTTSSYKSSPFLPAVPPSSSNRFPSVSKPATPFSKPPLSSPKPPSSSASSFGPTTASPNPSQSSKVTLSPASSGLTDKKNKMKYVMHEKDPLPIYIIPKDIKDLIKKDIVPGVLYKPLSPLTYTDYFAALLYAEDHYIEKWSNFQLVNVTVELQEAEIYRKFSNKKHFHESDEKKDTLFAAFKIDAIPEERPFLLSRDFVFAKPTGRKVDPFQGIIYRVKKSTTVLVEFEGDFYSQHHPNRKYDISFSFNRVCLKRAHQAVSAASDPLFQDYLFPGYASRKEIATSASLLSSNYKLDTRQNSAVRHILSFQGPPPYLVEGPLCVTISKQLSESGMVVQEAVLKIYKGSPQSRILICAPINRTCDALMRSLKQEIPESHMFRANAAFRELDGVPVDILPSCLYKGECFSCPSLQKLKTFRVILSTFVSSFRLCNEGITAGHFSHIFLVDASSATEPETMIALSNLASEKTAVIVTGAPNNRSGWVRSDIARKKGLRVSYFERLHVSKRYSSLDPAFITQLVKP
ncbi:hypothetical protein Dsin_009426 [Dipteronia sinensis]|uniref:Helicase MOV-10-like beta-barrel domain-containing protein n=1 Tax=Dipteronia sinensis TaxID=43782 RepID=A0AAE0AQJ2_9ROSI|nr:hypothetical protein Dsin_009426 [Dipteronia sinensis]